MSAEFFLDTNIFLYAFDGESPSKRALAARLINRALDHRQGVVSWQVCQEFLHAALHKSSADVPTGILDDYHARVLKPMCRIHSSDAIYRRALEIHRQTQYRFYDSLIVAAALESGAPILYSEDLQDGRIFGPLRIENPFR